MSASAPVLLDPAHYRRMPWKNGAGVTIDIAAAYRAGGDATGWSNLLWRFGRTRIEQPGPFSDLSGYDRVLAVIEGRGLVLHPRDRAPLEACEPFVPVRFPGEWAIASDLTGGPVGVLNLLADRTRHAIDLVFPPVGAAATVSGATCIALALDDAVLEFGGQTTSLARDFALRVDDAARLEIAPRSGRVAVAVIRG